MRDFHIDLIWAKIQIAITAIGGWLGYFVSLSKWCSYGII